MKIMVDISQAIPGVLLAGCPGDAREMIAAALHRYAVSGHGDVKR
jgi:hypothetical protein